MKKSYLIFNICFLLIVGSIFSYFILSNNNDVVYDDTGIIDASVIDIEKTNKEIIDEYVNKYNNEDVVGEINILNSGYKKAIMQSSDNEYYLNHLEDKTSSYMGSIYLDFRVDIDNDKKLLIFGHNSNSIKMPFEILENYYSSDYHKGYKFIQITTENKTRIYEIYSVFVEVSDFSYMQTEFKNEDEWYQHIKNFKDKSMYDTGVNIDKDDNILILQTCSTHSDYRKYDKKYLLVIGKEVDSVI